MAEQLKNSNWRSLNDVDTILPVAFEGSFTAASDYSIVTFGSMASVEGGCVMFKHKVDSYSYGMFFSKAFGSCIIRRTTNGTWEYKTTIGV